MLIASILMFGFGPSVAGMLIANTNALRIRLYKYDYLAIELGLRDDESEEARNHPF